jgi:uncharacterized protein
MSVRPQGDGIEYQSLRQDDSVGVSLSARYRPVGTRFQADNGSLEYFLTERYCLYNLDHQGAPYRLEIDHPPWPLQVADAEFARNTMADGARLSVADMKPLLHCSKRQDMVAWPPTTAKEKLVLR